MGWIFSEIQNPFLLDIAFAPVSFDEILGKFFQPFGLHDFNVSTLR